MKLNAMSILRETLIVLPLAMLSVPFVLAIGITSRMAFSQPPLLLIILVLSHLVVSCGVMLVFGVVGAVDPGCCVRDDCRCPHGFSRRIRIHLCDCTC